jgi:DNA repair protein RecO (recombination protein O)
MEFRDQAIVLRLGSFKEADLWVRLLSPSRGVFSAFAFGGSKSRRRFSGCLDLFNEALFQVKSQGEYLALQEGLLLKGPDRLRRDWRRLGVAVNCALFLESFCRGAERAERVHRLFVSLLNNLETSPHCSTLLPMFFRIRLAFEQGYALNPRQCSDCGNPLLRRAGDQALLPLGENGLICRDCASKSNGNSGNGRRFALGAGSLGVLRHILEEPLGDWQGMTADEHSQRECVRAVEAFLQHHTGLNWLNGGFRRKS